MSIGSGIEEKMRNNRPELRNIGIPLLLRSGGGTPGGLSRDSRRYAGSWFVCAGSLGGSDGGSSLDTSDDARD